MNDIDVFGEQADRYDEWFERNRQILDSEIAAIRELLPVFAKGIEIGTGTGIFASALGIRDGVEPSVLMGRRAEARGIRVVRAKAEDLPLEDGAYDLALMVTVDCFLDDMRRALREARRILSQDGSLILAFLDRGTPLGRELDAEKASDDFYRAAHFHSSEEMKTFLIYAGFTITGARQTVFSFENRLQDIWEGTGEGLFAVLRAERNFSGS